MNVGKIIMLVALVFALVASLVEVPDAAAVTACAGLLSGCFVAKEEALLFLGCALTLALLNGAALPVPVVGPYLLDVLQGLGALLSAAACSVAVKVVIQRQQI